MSESKWPILRNVGLAAVVFVVVLSGVLYASLNLSGSLSSTTNFSETASSTNSSSSSSSFYQTQDSSQITPTINAKVISNITVGSEPKGAAYDPLNGLLYVADYGSLEVTVINVSTNKVVTTISTGQEAWKPTYNPVNNMIYVGNDYSDVVTVINPDTNTVISNITVCDYTVGTFFDSLNNLTYVLCDETDQVVALNSTNNIVATIGLPAGPGNGGYAITPSDQIYIADYRGDDVNVINGTTNNLTTSFVVGTGPGATAYDASDQLIYVAIAGNPTSPGNTTVLLNSTNNEVAQNIQIGSFPETLIYLPSFDTVVSANAFSNSLSFMNGTTVISTISNVGSEPSGFAYDPSLQELFVADLGSNSLAVVQLSYGEVQPPCIGYVPIVISNPENGSTPTPFQQMLNIDSVQYSRDINSNWSNVEFSFGSGCSDNLLESWIEENPSNSSLNTIIWVNLDEGIAPYGNETIFMDFMSSNVLSANGPTGEAPQLSQIYGKYDNGALVFSFYDNFNGTALSDKWQQGGNTAQSGGYIGPVINDTPATVDDGMVVHYNGTQFGNGQWDWVQSIQTFNPQTNILDAYAYFNGLTNAATNQQIGWSAPGQNSSFEYAVSDGNLEYNGSSPIKNHYILLASPGTHTALLNGVTSAYQVFSVWSDSVGRAYALTNYSGLTVANGDWPSTSAHIHFSEINGCPYSVYVQWTRVRALPPNGVMPTVAFDSLVNIG